MKKGLAITLFLLLFCIVCANAGQYKIKSDNIFGCTSKEQFKKISNYLRQRDKAAFQQSMISGISLGQCTIFKANEPVYLVETSVFSGMIKIRREGETTEYWTIIEAAISQ